MKTGVKLGLAGLFVCSSFGMVLELLLFLGVPFYAGDPFLRRLWSLAHAHGTLCWLVYLVYCHSTGELEMNESLRRVGRNCSALAATTLPLGFLLGGLGHANEQPSWPIVLVPVGGTLLGVSLLLALFAGSERPKDGRRAT